MTAYAANSWKAIVARLEHPDVWGPGGLYPLATFRRRGRGWVARCPAGAHADRHPSFSMPEGRSFGHCFSCGYKRTWISFVLEQQGQSPDARGAAFRGALAVLAERAGVALDAPETALVPAASPATVLAGVLKQALLSEHPKAIACRDYLVARGVSAVTVPRLPLGAWTDGRELSAALRAARQSTRVLGDHGLLARYVPEHPLIFVYEDSDGVTGFKCRKPSLAKKSVLNARGFGGALEGRSLFGVTVAREAIARYQRAILVEGEFDALGWHAASLAVGRHFELVALGGTAKPTIEKFRTLHALGARIVYLALDGDAPGEAATATACLCGWEAGIDVAVLPMPAGCKDPDEVLARHGPAAGAELLFDLPRAEPAATWLARYQLRRFAPVTVEQTAQLREATAEAARVMPAAARARYAEIVAEALGVLAAPLSDEWARHAADVRARAVRDRLRQWAQAWGKGLGEGALADHLDDAARHIASARAELAGAADQGSAWCR